VPWAGDAQLTGCDASTPLSSDLSSYAPYGANAALELARRLAGNVPDAVHALLFHDFATARNATADSVSLLNALRDAVSRTEVFALTAPRWNPYARDVFAPGAVVYSVLVARLTLLERMCCGASGVLAHYLFAYLDSHLLAACAVEDMGSAPLDGSRAERALLAAYAAQWVRGTSFGVHSLPARARTALAETNVFGVPAAKKRATGDFLVDVFNRCVPYRCQVRQLCALLAAAEAPRDRDLVHALLAASFLGVYRHAKKRPLIRERIAVYRVFFFHSLPPTMLAVLVQAARARGAAHYAPPTRSVEAVSAWIAARRVSPRTGVAGAFVNQHVLVSVVREFAVAMLPTHPALYAVLCQHVPDWHDAWAARRVCGYADTLRARLTTGSAFAARLDVVLPPNSALPTHTLFAPRPLPFHATLLKECIAALDAHGVSDEPLDMVFTPELEHVLRCMVSGVVGEPRPCVGVPTCEAEEGEFATAGRVPVRRLGADPAVIRAYNATAFDYASRASGAARAHIVAFVRWVAARSVYQFSWVRAFAAACVDRQRVYVIPLPPAVREAQAEAALALRHATEIPCFVCLGCRRFCGKVERPGRGCVSVAIGEDSLHDRVLRAARMGKLAAPTREHHYTSLVHYYKESASSHVYPDDPALYSSPAAALHAPELAAFLAPQPHFNFDPTLSCDAAAAAPLLAPAITWVCASKRVKVEGRKTRNAHRAVVSFDPRETANAQRNAEKRRRRDARLFHAHSQCAGTRLHSVNMLGFALRLDNRVYGACCACLTFMDVAAAPPDRFRGRRFVCAACAEASGAVCSSLERCHVCKAPCADARSLVVVDSGAWRTLYLCRKHEAPESWLWRSATYVSIEAAESELIPRTRARARRGIEASVGERVEDTAWVDSVVRLFNRSMRFEEAAEAGGRVDEEEDEEEEEEVGDEENEEDE